jgi:hypothetical protein
MGKIWGKMCTQTSSEAAVQMTGVFALPPSAGSKMKIQFLSQ